MKLNKRWHIIAVLALLIVAMMCVLTACGDDDKKGNGVLLESITLTVDKTEIEADGQVQLSVSITPENCDTVYNGKSNVDYDENCIRYYIISGDKTTHIGNGKSITYQPEKGGNYTVYAEYLPSSSYGSEGRYESNRIDIKVRGISISSVDELKAIANSDKGYELSCDIDLGGITWSPIAFSGNLDGAGHTISNFVLGDNTDNLGFFSTLSGTVSNVTFSNVTVDMRNSKSNIGVIAGINKGTIDSCSVEGNIDATTSTYVGGIVGKNDASGLIVNSENLIFILGNEYVGGIAGINYGTISKSKNKADIDGTDYVGGIAGKMEIWQNNSAQIVDNENSGEVAGEDYVGGIAGYVYASVCTVENCKNLAEINGNNNTAGLFGYVSLVNGNLMTITNSTNLADILGGEYVGGMLGYVSGKATIADITNANNITGKVYVGGVLGYGQNVTLTNCENKGNVVATSSKTIDNRVCSYIGGLAGGCGDITNCSNEVDITGIGGYVGGLAGKSGAINGSTNTGKVTGGDYYVGGLVGFAGGSIIDSRNDGEVKSTSSYVGGLAGRNDFGINSSARITDNKSNGSVVGEDYTGGLIGYAYGNKLTVESCDAAAEVSGANYTGGFLGSVYLVNGGALVTITNCTLSADVTGDCYTGGVLGHSDSTVTIDRQVNNSTITGKAYLGGIVGKGTYTTLKNCENYGTITSTATITESGNSCSYVGGLGGVCYTIEYGVNNIDISTNGFYVGGLAGKCGVVKNSTNSGNINGGSSYVGGLVGRMETGINSSVEVSDNTNKGSVTGKDYVGGIAGYYYGKNCNLDTCKNENNIIGANNVGGLFGCVYLVNSGVMNIVNCNSSGVVTGDINFDNFNGSVSGNVIIQ